MNIDISEELKEKLISRLNNALCADNINNIKDELEKLIYELENDFIIPF